MHPRRGQPDTRLRLVRGSVDHRHLADPGSTQRKGKSAAALSTADDGHVVINLRPLRHPILRIGPNEP